MFGYVKLLKSRHIWLKFLYQAKKLSDHADMSLPLFQRFSYWNLELFWCVVIFLSFILNNNNLKTKDTLIFPMNSEQTQNCEGMSFPVLWWLDLEGSLFHKYKRMLNCHRYHFQQYFRYIVAFSFIGEGNRSSRRKSPKLYHIMLYTSPRAEFELTTSVVIGTDCLGT